MEKRRWAIPEKDEDIEYGYEVDSDNIALTLFNFSKFGNGYTPTKEDLEDCKSALAHLYTICQNEHNNDCFRNLYRVLAKATKNIENISHYSLKYEYQISDELLALNNGTITEEEWKEKGSPCLVVIYYLYSAVLSFPLGKPSSESFIVSLKDLEDFVECTDIIENTKEATKKTVLYKKEDCEEWADNIINIFKEMLDTENYVENVFLS